MKTINVTFNFKDTVETNPIIRNLLLELQFDDLNNITGKKEKDKKEILDKVVEDYFNTSNAGKVLYQKAIIQFATDTTIKKPLKHYLFSKSLRNNFIRTIINDESRGIVEEIDQTNLIVSQRCLYLLDLIKFFVMDFEKDLSYEFVVESVFPFYLRMLQAIVHLLSTGINFEPTETKKFLLLLSNTIKQISKFFKINNGDLIRNYSLDFIELLLEIFKNDKVVYETRKRANLALMFALNRLPTDQTEFIENKDCPALDFLKNINDTFSINLKSIKLENCFLNNGNKIILLYSVFKANDIQFVNKWFGFLCRNLIDCSHRSSDIPYETVLITKTLFLISKNFCKVTNEEFKENVKILLGFCWGHLKHFVDFVRQKTKKIFINIVQYAKEERFQGCQLIQYIISQTINEFHETDVRLTALEVLCSYLDIKLLEKNFKTWLEYLLGLMREKTFANEAFNICLILLTKQIDLHRDEFTKTLFFPIIELIRTEEHSNKISDNIIMKGIESSPHLFRILFPTKRHPVPSEYKIQLKCLNFARKKNIMIPLEVGENRKKYWRNLIPFSKLELFLMHNDDEIRLSVLELIVETSQSTEDFDDWELQTFVNFLIENSKIQSIRLSNLIINLFKKIITRFFLTHTLIKKRIDDNIKENQKEPNLVFQNIIKESRQLLQHYDNFIITIINKLLLTVEPYANSIQRRVGLEILLFLHKNINNEIWLNSFHHDEIVNLKHILRDRNRAGAMAVLATFPPEKLQFTDSRSTHRYFEKCLAVACNNKPLKCLAAPFMFEVGLFSQFGLPCSEGSDLRLNILNILYNNINYSFKASTGNILKAAQEMPLHGMFSSMKSLIASRSKSVDTNAEYGMLFDKIVNLSFTIKSQIFSIVCDVKMSLVNLDYTTDKTSTDQLILVYAWRAIKENMLLLTEIVTQTIENENESLLISIKQLTVIGWYFVQILKESVHKGVYEQTYITFSAICLMFKKSQYPEINKLPSTWLNLLNYIIRDNSFNPRNSFRVIGFPFFVMSVFSTELPSERDMFNETTKRIFKNAANEVKTDIVLRIQSLNILKAIFNNPKSPYFITMQIRETLFIALKGLQSPFWIIRSRSSSLFAVLLTKMFNVKGSSNTENFYSKKCLTFIEFESHYPSLVQFLFSELSEKCQKENSSSILFYIFLILLRINPSYTEESLKTITENLLFITCCSINCNYRIREIAAKAFTSLLPSHLLLNHLSWIFNEISDKNITDSKCHGLLLQIFYLFKNKNDCKKVYNKFLLLSCVNILENLRKFCHRTIALNMEIIVILLDICNDLNLLKKLILLVSNLKIHKNEIVTCKMKFKWYCFYIITYILLNKFNLTNNSFNFVVNEMKKIFCEDDMETEIICVKFLIYLNQTHNKYTCEESPLIVGEEVEVPDFVKDLVDSFDVYTTRKLLETSHGFVVKFLAIRYLNRRYYNKEYLILVYLLMRYYIVCLMRIIYWNQFQYSLDSLIDKLLDNNDEIVSAIISCINEYFLYFLRNNRKKMEFPDKSKLVKLLMYSASPAAAVHRRLAVAQFMATCPCLFTKNVLLQDDNLENMLNTAMLLLEDDELLVRNTFASYKSLEINDTPDDHYFLWDLSADRVKIELLSSLSKLVHDKFAINFEFSWSCRYLPPYGTDTRDIYGEWNQYAENMSLQECTMKTFKNEVWDVKSTNKHLLVRRVTNNILKALLLHKSPMVLTDTKDSVTSTLKTILMFLERHNFTNEQDFKENFSMNFVKIFTNCLHSTTKKDYLTFKAFFVRLYSDFLDKTIINCPQYF